MLKVLIVSDAASAWEQIQGELDKKGYKTILSMNDEDALRSALQEKPDVALVNVISKADGHEVCARLRRHASGHLPIIMLTEFFDSQVLQPKFKADVYLMKPYRLVELVFHINTLVGEDKVDPTSVPISSNLGLLTGLSHRRSLLSYLEEESLKNPQMAESLFCLMIHLKNLATIRSELGPLVGEQLLSRVMKFILSLLKGNDFLARYKTEIFIFLTRSPLNKVRRLAVYMKETLEALQFSDDQRSLQLGINIDLYELPHGSWTTSEDLSKQLNEVLSLNKKPDFSYGSADNSSMVVIEDEI